MADYKYVVFSNSTPGDDTAFNDWYDRIHLPDVLAVPGFVAATRMLNVSQNGEEPKHRYCAIYEICSDDIEITLADLMGRAGTDRMVLSPSLAADVETTLWEVLGNSEKE